MFFSRGSLRLPPASFQTHVAVDRGLRVFAAERRGVTFRTHFLPGARAKERDIVVLWFIASGWVEWSGRTNGRAEGRTLVALSESAFDGAGRAREFQLQSSGEPFVALEVRAPASLIIADVSRGPTPQPCPGAAWEAVDTYLSRVLVPTRTASTAYAIELLQSLAAAGLVRAPIVDRVVREEDPRMTRIWDATAVAYSSFDTRPTLKRVADACDMSLRNLSRFIDLAYSDLLLPAAGWRDMTTDLRLMIAMLFLSCPSLSIAEVASAVGYGHAQGMANAFKSAGLPPPREVQAFATSRSKP